MEAQVESGPFLFVGNQLSLDFINTEKIAEGERVNLLPDYAALKDWLIATESVASSVFETAERNWTVEARNKIHEQAITLRATLRKMMERITTGESVLLESVAEINRWLQFRRGVPVLTQTPEGFALAHKYEVTEIESLLAPVAESAAELLASGDRSFLRKCENPQCILYFYDTSKNHVRRWCSMSACGNRHKAAAHYQRHRQETRKKTITD